jgi:hypothetical protein
MSKANNRIFYLIGLGVILVAAVPLVFGLLGSTFTTTYLPNGGVVHEVTSFGNPVLFWLAIGLYVVGGITAFVGYLGALIKLAQLEQWLWFILLLVFSGITMLVYIFVGPETRAGSLPPTYAHSG